MLLGIQPHRLIHPNSDTLKFRRSSEILSQESTGTMRRASIWASGKSRREDTWRRMRLLEKGSWLNKASAEKTLKSKKRQLALYSIFDIWYWSIHPVFIADNRNTWACTVLFPYPLWIAFYPYIRILNLVLILYTSEWSRLLCSSSRKSYFEPWLLFSGFVTWFILLGRGILVERIFTKEIELPSESENSVKLSYSLLISSVP